MHYFVLLAYLHSSTDVEVFSYDLTGRNNHRSRPLEANSIRKFTSIPGLILLHTNKGVALLHPGTLELIKMELKGHTHGAHGGDGGGKVLQYQFNVEEALFSVVKVWDVESSVNDATDVSGGKFMLALALSLSLSLSISISFTMLCPLSSSQGYQMITGIRVQNLVQHLLQILQKVVTLMMIQIVQLT